MIPGAYNASSAGPLGQVTETIIQSTKVSAEHHNTTCTSSVDFYMVAGSGANKPGSTVQVSNNFIHCAHKYNSTQTA